MASRRTLPNVLALGWLALIVFAAQFCFFGKFGLYEDDYMYVLPFFGSSFRDLLIYCAHALVHPIQARPLYFPLQAALAYFSFKIGGLAFCHLLSFPLVTIAGFLLFRLLQPALGGVPALFGASAFALFPLDTSRQILMHQMALLVPTVSVLGSFLLFTKQRFIASYVLAGLLLLTYESAYLPFLIAPVFRIRRGGSTVRAWLRHAAIFFGVAGVIFVLRALLGESRAVETTANLGAIWPRILIACTLGPWNGIVAFVTRPVDAFSHSSADGYFFMFLTLVAAYLCFRFRTREACTTGGAAELATKGALLAAGLFAWAFSYVLAFGPDYFPPVVSVGRLIGVDCVPAIGAGIALGAGFAILLQSFSGLRPALVCAAALLVAGLVGFHQEIQIGDYVSHWQQQRRFWLALIDPIQDVRPRDVVIFETGHQRGGLTPITQGFSQFGQPVYWNFAFTRFVSVPGKGIEQPSFHAFSPFEPVHREGTQVVLESPVWDPARWGRIVPDNLVYLKDGGDRLVRMAGPVDMKGFSVMARPMPDSSNHPLHLTKFFWKIFADHPEEQWSTLKNARSYPH